jgi:hypothetical protein
MRRRGDYLDTGFVVWPSNQGWFWSINKSTSSGGAIGAAATEAQAVLEARASIEEIFARHSRLMRASTTALAAIDWEKMLANLERHLTDLAHGTA